MSRFSLFGAIGCTALIVGVSCSEHAPTDVAGAPGATAISTPIVLDIGETASVAALQPENDVSANLQDLHWISSDSAVVSIQRDTIVVAKAPGEARVSSTSGAAGAAMLMVLGWNAAPVTSIAVSLSDSSVAVGASPRATATMTDVQGNTLSGRLVTWRSSDPSIATINLWGQITAIHAGTTTIAASRRDVAGSTTLTVGGGGTSSAPVETVRVTLPTASVAVGATVQGTMVEADAAGNALSGRTGTWASSNDAVATVSPTGLVKGVSAGSATITATSEGVAGSAPVTVTASSPTTPAAPTGPGKAIFADGFESGSLSYSQNGVSWPTNAWVDVSTSIAHSGSHAARFRQGESKNWGELRFGGLPKLSEVYIQFYLYYPSGKETPSVGPKVKVLGTANDKFFRLWGNTDADYSALPGDKVGASVWGDGGGQDGKLGVEYQYAPSTGSQYGMGEGDPPQSRVAFITDANRGRWIRMRIHAKVASAADNDGVVQIWADDNLILSRTALHSYPGAGAPNSFTNGYLLGAANNGFQAGQYTYIDDVVFSTGGFAAP